MMGYKHANPDKHFNLFYRVDKENAVNCITFHMNYTIL